MSIPSTVKFDQEIHSKDDKSFSNILSSFMSLDPKKIDLFQVKEISSYHQNIFKFIFSTCTICLKKIKVPCKPDNCSHIFCKRCLTKWRNINQNCPICRIGFNKIIKIINV